MKVVYDGDKETKNQIDVVDYVPYIQVDKVDNIRSEKSKKRGWVFKSFD